MSTGAIILGCLSKNRARRYQTCEKDYQISVDANSSTVRSLPYPEMALWYLTLEQNSTTSVSLTFQISSSKCTREQCGTYGTCQIFTSQQNIYSTCTCVAGEMIESIIEEKSFLSFRFSWIWLYG